MNGSYYIKCVLQAVHYLPVGTVHGEKNNLKKCHNFFGYILYNVYICINKTHIRHMKKFKLEIEQDTHPDNPRSWDNLGTMVCFHRRYDLGDDNDYCSSNYDGWDEMKEDIIEKENVHTILPLYLYDHSGITMNTTGFSCNWDSGQVGFIFVSKDKVKKEYVKDTRVEDILKGEVETYDQYLTGDVWGYKIYEVTTCDHGHEHEELVDSCWGFYGEEECRSEGESIMKYHTEKELV